MRSLIDRLTRREGDDPSECGCSPTVEDGTLVVDAEGCDGDLASSPACRETVVRELADWEVDDVVLVRHGLEYRYDDAGVALLSAAGRFVDLVAGRDERIADLAARDPLSAAGEATARGDPVGTVAAESGLAITAEAVGSYDDVLTATVGFTVGHYYLDRTVPEDTRLREVRSLETGSEVRIYSRPDSVPLYALDVLDLSLSIENRELVLEGYETIADGDVEGRRAPSRAIETVADAPPDPAVTAVLGKHTNGYGVLEDLFADPAVTDVYATSPVSSNPLRVVVDGESMSTNVYLTEEGAAALASRVRRTSGRAFSRASPTVDATASLENGTGVRIAGVTDPVADGVAFAFRERAADTFTLPGLVANGTVPPEAAAFLSVAVERNAATLVAGTRGAGKTTLLGTLLYELPPDTRTVLIEDTPELPVGPLQSVDRDVQALRTGTGDGPEITPVEALRTALRLGDGALVVGEIRGEEAPVLYEAMRVGANANAVLGTIHGDGGDAVYERVVSDLAVPPSSFGATDLVVTVQAYATPDGRKRRLAAIEEVVSGEDGVWFESLYELEVDRAVSTARIDRGESRVVERLAGPTETYADVREAIGERATVLESLANDGRTTPEEVAAVYADRRIGG